MRKVVAAGAMAAAVAACSTSRGEDGGPTVDRTYQVGGFERVEVAGSYEVDIKTGSQVSVSARGPEKAIERMIVEVEGDKLLIHTRKRQGFNWGWSDDGPVRLAVTVPALRGAAVAGSGGIRVDKVQGEAFAGSIAGSGDLEIGSVEVQTLSLGIAGSGEARARQGRARQVDYEIAGSGDIDARGIASETAAVSIAGSGNVTVNATKTADVDIAGSGDVEVSGGAKCKVSKAGSGDVRCV